MKNPEHRDFFPGALEMMILRRLQRQPQSGCTVERHIKRTSDDLPLEEKSFYLALQCLLREGLVKVDWGVKAPRRLLQADPSRHQALEVSRSDRMLRGIARARAAGEL